MYAFYPYGVRGFLSIPNWLNIRDNPDPSFPFYMDGNRVYWGFALSVTATGGSVGWAPGYHAGGREFDTESLKIADEKVLAL